MKIKIPVISKIVVWKQRIKSLDTASRTGIVINVFASIIVTIIVTIITGIIAKNANEELKESSKGIELLTIRIDSTITEMNSVVIKMDSMVQKIHDYISRDLAKQPLSKSKSIEDNLSKNRQTEKEWGEGYDQLNKGNYDTAIALFKNLAKNPQLKADAYFNIAIAYARLSQGVTEADAESDRNHMLNYLKKAARLESEDAQKLLQKYGEDW
jgi:tetratricopeptide (TPR) repeat protein